MGLRRIKLGALDVVVSYPDQLARRVRGLGGILRRRQRQEALTPPAPQLDAASDANRELWPRVKAIEWYHTIDLGNGVLTPGWFDLRPVLDQYPLPARMDGLRVLDVATFDGFWAFEFERRGAAEVVALDVDSFGEIDMAPRIRRDTNPQHLARRTGEGFALCHEVLNSSVQRRVLNVYELSPERVGRFDLVFISDLLLHLRNPMLALDNVCKVTAGHAVIVDVFEPRLPRPMMSYHSGEVHNIWWSFGLDALTQMVSDAGFGDVRLRNRFLTGYRGQKPILWHAAFEARP